MTISSLELDLQDLQDDLAAQLVNTYTQWQNGRHDKLKIWREVSEYVSATDTTTTANKSLPWSNSTTRPKLTQIRDALETQYMDVLFPSSDWLDWQVDPSAGITPADADLIRRAILSYMNSKINHPDSEFYTTIKACIIDYIETGWPVAMGNNYVYEQHDNGENTVATYFGPKLVRFDPYDAVTNPASVNSSRSPWFIRSVWNLGDLAIRAENSEMIDAKAFEKALDRREQIKSLNNRGRAQTLQIEETEKLASFIAEGFGTLTEYYESNMVEILSFFGDFYDTDNKKLYKNVEVWVMDRSTVIVNRPNPSLTGSSRIRNTSWRQSRNTNMGMGPLENIVGLQYRLDHIENMLADGIDLNILPIMKIRGQVDEFKFEPLGKINLPDEDSDVEFVRPPIGLFEALQVIESIENSMEELAGVPKQSSGFRTPGEKTKFEVQVLENNASRLFLHRISWFERTFLEHLLNDMLEAAVRNMPASGEKLMVTLPEGEVEITITPEQLSAKGRIRPKGARSLVEKANQLQTIVQLFNTGLGNNPRIWQHISSKELTNTLATLLDLDKINNRIVGEYAGLIEDQETQELLGGTPEQQVQ